MAATKVEIETVWEEHGVVWYNVVLKKKDKQVCQVAKRYRAFVQLDEDLRQAKASGKAVIGKGKTLEIPELPPRQTFGVRHKFGKLEEQDRHHDARFSGLQDYLNSLMSQIGDVATEGSGPKGKDNGPKEKGLDCWHGFFKEDGTPVPSTVVPGLFIPRTWEDCDDPYDIDNVRNWLYVNNEMAVLKLITHALMHAAETVTHSDAKIMSGCRALSSGGSGTLCAKAATMAAEVMGWAKENIFKVILLIIGLGGTIFKAKTIIGFIEKKATTFVKWGKRTSTLNRFAGFTALMSFRLVLCLFIPPASPAFGIIIQQATPDNQKWTAMPLFLLASTAAGCLPWLGDKLLQIFFACCKGDWASQDFKFTFLVHFFVAVWPLTFWTIPLMESVFRTAGGGKLGASIAVIVGHGLPFMGAQTTMIQRYFLPHPLDTILSQPFGMSEDLISMAMAEALHDPRLASKSLTIIFVGFNLIAAFLPRLAHDDGLLDMQSILIGIVNFIVGVVNLLVMLPKAKSAKQGIAMAGGQLFIQLFIVPFFVSLVYHPNAPGKGSSPAPASSTNATPKNEAREPQVKEHLLGA